MSNAVSDDKKQEYLDIISSVLENAEGADEGFKQISNASSTLCDVNQVMNYNPQMSVVRNIGGNVIGYDYKYTPPEEPNTDSMGVNSNNDHGSFGYASGGGGYSRGGGAGRYDGPYYDKLKNKNYAGGINNDEVRGTNFVSGLISAGYAAASAIGKFGKNVASRAADVLDALDADYNALFGPLMVDGSSHGIANAIRVLFGVDSDGTTRMYMDEDTIGAMGILLRDNHFFDSNPNKEAISKPEGATNSGYNRVTFPVPFVETFSTMANPFINSGVGWASDFLYCFDVVFTGLNSPYYKMYWLTDTPNAHLYCIRSGNTVYYGCDVQPVHNRMIATRDDGTLVNWAGWSINFNWWQDSAGNGMYWGTYTHIEKYIPDIEEYTGAACDYALWCAAFGVVQGGEEIPGISDQAGATDMVDAITGADPHVVGQNLYNQYPQVMGEPVLVNVMDDSCNQVTNRYFSVPLTYSPTNLTFNTPINATLQLDPSFNLDDLNLNPTLDIDIDKLVDQIILQLLGSGAGRDIVQVIVDPDDPAQDPQDINIVLPEPTIPNTGSGVTPETELPQTDVQGMWHVYNPSSAEVSALGSWLWTSSIIEQIARMFNDPTNSIIGLHAIYGEPHVTSPASIVVGNLTSTVSARVVSSQYTQVDCGSVWLTEFFGNVFDYAPYTEVSIFLPFIGIVSLDVADVMRAQLQVVYNVDVYTGACIAQVSVTRDGVGGVIYQYAGNCAISYPVSSISYNNIFSSMVSVAGGIAALATGAGPLGIAMNVTSALGQAGRASVSRSGSFSANAGAMGSKKPYLIIRRPQPNMALQFEKYDGRGSNFTSMLSQCTGYTKCKEVHLNVPGAYKEELDEIERLLKEGIILPA